MLHQAPSLLTWPREEPAAADAPRDLTADPPRAFYQPVNLPPFQTLLDAHGPDVYRLLAATVGRVDADDCYQETWLAALRYYPRLRESSNLRSWILTIAHRKALDHFRAGRRRPVPVPEPAEPGPRGAVTDAADPGERLAGLDDQLWQAVRRLPTKQRAAVALRFVADADYAEISSVMGTSEEAARRNVHEGLKRLRTEYTP
jgi:RNA polymerase sigma factor (sigma-70 family)